MDRQVSFGLTLANRGLMFGATSPAEMLQLSETAEACGYFDAIWVGDSLTAKPRLESVALLSAIAACTRRVRLGPACFGSFAVRHPVLLAYQWASLDQLSGGRTVLVACLGGGSPEPNGDLAREYRTFGIPISERAARMEESIEILRKLWSQDHVTWRGRFYQLEDVTVEPKPAQRLGPPIWIANNPHAFNYSKTAFSELYSPQAKSASRAVQRVARFADGWMTTMITPEGFRDAWISLQAALRAERRDPVNFSNCLYFNVHIGDDRTRAYEESKRFLDLYYSTAFPKEALDLWVAYGDGRSCAEHIRRFLEVGVRHVALRLTSWSQKEQLRRVINELMPLLLP